MKKLLSILLCFTMLFTFSACNKKEEPQKSKITLLPYNLEYGMSYDKSKEVCKDFPTINPANSNNGYFSEKFSPKFTDYEKFFEIDSDKLYEESLNADATVFDPGYYFSFNQSKELYEFYVMTNISNGESSAEYLFNAYVEHYYKKLGKEARPKKIPIRLLHAGRLITQKSKLFYRKTEVTS